MSIDWASIEDAIVTWVLNSSGLDDQHVIWEGQPMAPTPSGLYIGLKLHNIRFPGLDDPRVYTATPGAPANNEATTTIRAQRRVLLTMNCYAANATGASGAAAVLETVLAGLNIDTITDALTAAHVAIANFDDIQAIDGVVDSVLLEPRATVEVTVHVAGDTVFTGPAIQTVNITNQSVTPNETFRIN